MEDFSKKLLSISLSILIVLGLIELGLRLIGLGYDSAGFENDPLLHHRHKVNYQFINNVAESEVDQDFLIRYDHLGCVVGEQTTRYPNKKNIVLMGDSYTEGAQVPYKKSVAGLLESEFSQYNIYNFGVGSYSPVIYNLQWKKDIKALNPSCVILQLYVNDIAEDSLYLSRASTDLNGMIEAIDGGDIPVLRRLGRNFYLYRYLRKLYLQYKFDQIEDKSLYQVGANYAEPNFDFTGSRSQLELRELTRQMDELKIPLKVLCIPSRYRMKQDSSYRSRFNDQVAKHVFGESYRHDIEFLDFQKYWNNSSREDLFFDNDIHFNEAGHRIYYELLSTSIHKL